MGFIWGLALNVWREAVRDRLLMMMTASGALLIAFSLILGEMAVGGHERVIQNMGFWVLGIWGLLSVIYMGSSILSREFKQKTAYLILSRPIGRTTFLMGKFFGIVLVLSTLYLALCVTWLFFMMMSGIQVTGAHYLSLGFIYGEWLFIAALSIFFASFTTPVMHNFFLIGIIFLGHWSNDLRIFSENTEHPLFKIFLKILYYLLPNLSALNFREMALYHDNISTALVFSGAGIVLGWIFVVLFGANLIFINRRLF